MQMTFGVHVMNLWRGQKLIFPVPTRWRSNWRLLLAYETVQIKENEKQTVCFRCPFSFGDSPKQRGYFTKP